MTTWTASDMQRIIEVDIRLKRDFAYDPASVAAVLATHSEAASRMPGIRSLGISYENLSLTLPGDVDLPVKARRLHDLFGDGTRIIFLYRNQLTMIRSLYAEFLCSGMRRDFTGFVDHLIETRFQSILLDMLFDKVIGLYGALFGEANILAVPLEVAMEDTPRYLGKVCDFLGLESWTEPLPRLNESLSPQQLTVMRQLNEKTSHNLGATPVDYLHGHRQQNYFLQERGMELPFSATLDLQILNSNYRMATQLGKSAAIPPIATAYRDDQRDSLAQFFGPDNRLLAARQGIDLAAHGYLMR